MLPPAVALTIAGSDCCGGAGIQADLKVFSLLGVHGLTAITTIVAETPRKVHGVYPIAQDALQEQISCLLSSYPVAAIKTGLLGPAGNIMAVAEVLEDCEIPLVADPVLGSSTGTSFSSKEIVAAYRKHLLPLATVLTPNEPEAEILLGQPRRKKNPAELVRNLADKLETAVLLTGGHGAEEQIVDFLYAGGELTSFESPRLKLPTAHGTGCTLSSALAGLMAKGRELQEAVEEAKDIVNRSLRDSYEWPVGASCGELRALNHLPQNLFEEPASK